MSSTQSVTNPKTPERQAKPVECPWAPMRKNTVNPGGLNVVIPPQRRIVFEEAPRGAQNPAGRFGEGQAQ
jgi:hypothetical protein